MALVECFTKVEKYSNFSEQGGWFQNCMQAYTAISISAYVIAKKWM